MSASSVPGIVITCCKLRWVICSQRPKYCAAFISATRSCSSGTLILRWGRIASLVACGCLTNTRIIVTTYRTIINIMHPTYYPLCTFNLLWFHLIISLFKNFVFGRFCFFVSLHLFLALFLHKFSTPFHLHNISYFIRFQYFGFIIYIYMPFSRRTFPFSSTSPHLYFSLTVSPSSHIFLVISSFFLLPHYHFFSPFHLSCAAIWQQGRQFC